MKTPRIAILLFLALFSILGLSSCAQFQKLVGSDLAAELADAFKNAPLVLETIYKGEVVRVVIRKGSAIAVTEEGTQVPMEEISKADP